MPFAVAVALAATLDCGSNWSCFQDAVSRAQPATVMRSFSSEDGGHAEATTVSLGLTTISPPLATLRVRIESGQGSGLQETCTLHVDALHAMLDDIDTMAAISPGSFAVADSCRGALLPDFAQMKAVATLSPAEQIVPAGFENCGFSLGCAVRALAQRRPAMAWSVAALPFFGIDTTAVSLLRIDEFSGSDVTLYIRTVRDSVTFGPDLIALMKAKHLSDTQIAQAQQQANQAARKTIGLDGTCRFRTAVLGAMLRRWYRGEFSTDDWGQAERCSGAMFAGQR